MESQQAFMYLCQKLCDKPLVAHPRPNVIYHLATDAAAGDEKNLAGFGAVLSQIWEYGTDHVISHANRALKKNEENYSVYLLELAAVAWAIDHFSVFLCGRHFELFTDHQPLESLVCTSEDLKQIAGTDVGI